jgi:SAM-dependent MidA family methyltransferase
VRCSATEIRRTSKALTAERNELKEEISMRISQSQRSMQTAEEESALKKCAAVQALQAREVVFAKEMLDALAVQSQGQAARAMEEVQDLEDTIAAHVRKRNTDRASAAAAFAVSALCCVFLFD